MANTNSTKIIEEESYFIYIPENTEGGCNVSVYYRSEERRVGKVYVLV